jgi:mannan endo-1,4-beta-mannosidase
MSSFVKSVDRKHLVSVGDEGFYCIPDATDWMEDCSQGVDTIAFTKLRHIDVMSFHLYPDHWNKDIEWGIEWIKRHIRDARRLWKPAMLGEFGLRDKSVRNPVYKEWTDTVFGRRGTGALYWILSGVQDDGTLYPDYDGFTVYCPSPVCTTIGNFARHF